MVVFHANESLRRFQLVQKTDDRFLLRLELMGEGHEYWLQNVKADLREALGKKSVIEENLVDEIQPTASGKYLYVIREKPAG